MKTSKLTSSSVITILSVVATLSVAPAYSQSGSEMKATLPFDFVLKDKTIPAGNYIVEPIQLGGTVALRIRDTDGRAIAMAFVRAIHADAFQNEAKLVFHRYGNKHFLAEAWTAAERTGWILSKSRAEWELANKSSASSPDRVLIAVHER